MTCAIVVAAAVATWIMLTASQPAPIVSGLNAPPVQSGSWHHTPTPLP